MKYTMHIRMNADFSVEMEADSLKEVISKATMSHPMDLLPILAGLPPESFKIDVYGVGRGKS